MRLIARVMLYALVCAATAAGAQQSYPNKPIRLIVGFAPGGGTDILARALGQPLGESLGQQITVDNRAGAGGIIATELGAKAAPDGYTFLVGSSAGFAINPNLMAKLPYDPVKDFTPVGMFATLSYAVDVHRCRPKRCKICSRWRAPNRARSTMDRRGRVRLPISRSSSLRKWAASG